jgi:hypothetical protein
MMEGFGFGYRSRSGSVQIMIDLDPGGKKTYRSGSRSTTLPFRDETERVQHEGKFGIFNNPLAIV